MGKPLLPLFVNLSGVADARDSRRKGVRVGCEKCKKNGTVGGAGGLVV